MLLGLADILFAYAYDHRTTGGDPSVESAWTVATLSPLLSWLEVNDLFVPLLLYLVLVGIANRSFLYTEGSRDVKQAYELWRTYR